MHADRLYERAVNIRDGRENGLFVPILRHLALRGHVDAMILLAHWYTQSNDKRDLDGIGEPYSAANLYYRAWRSGGSSAALAAHSLALSYFNLGNMQQFRRWARRGARSGDYDCRMITKHFETRLPHGAARRLGRIRPEAKRDQCG